MNAHPFRLANVAIRQYRESLLSHPVLVQRLESAVDEFELAGDSRARDARRAWGQLEIVNAMHEGEVIDPGVVEPLLIAFEELLPSQ